MKQGRTLSELAAELERQQETKQDVIADTRKLRMITGPWGHQRSEDLEPEEVDDRERGRIHRAVDLLIEEIGRHPITKHAHRQIGERVKIPAKYYDRMLTHAPDLLAANVNRWFEQEPETRMVRLLDIDGDGQAEARAFLSNRYRRLDNYDLMQVVLPILQNFDGLSISSCEVTDQRLYLKAVTPRIQDEIKRGDVVQAGISISNSEIGLGSLRVEPLVFRLACMNGMIAQDYGMAKHHVGRATGGEGEAAEAFYAEDTLRAEDEAFWRKVRDIVRGTLERDLFGKIVQDMREAAEDRLTVSPVQAVEVLQKRHQLTDGEQTGILNRLIESGDLSMYGVANAVTAASQDSDDYDRATELEELGHQVLTMGADQVEKEARKLVAA